MADPDAAVATQLRNIEGKTGKTFAQLCKLIAGSGLTKVGEQRAMLMTNSNSATAMPTRSRFAPSKPALPATQDTDPMDAIYAGPKAPLRTIHERLHTAISKLGPYEVAPKKGYVSLRRKKQFATLGPATKDQIELGLNAKSVPASARLKALPPGGMCQYSVRLSSLVEVDAELLGWVRVAYDAAG